MKLTTQVVWVCTWQIYFSLISVSVLCSINKSNAGKSPHISEMVPFLWSVAAESFLWRGNTLKTSLSVDCLKSVCSGLSDVTLIACKHCLYLCVYCVSTSLIGKTAGGQPFAWREAIKAKMKWLFHSQSRNAVKKMKRKENKAGSWRWDHSCVE